MRVGMSRKEAGAADRELEGRSLEEILAWAAGRFGADLGFMTALGCGGVVLQHHLLKIDPTIEAHFIDTGLGFPETTEFLRRLKDEWNVRFVVHKPRMSARRRRKFIALEPWKTDPDLCCRRMKVEPFLRIIHTKKAWVSALRRDQGAARSRIRTVEFDGRGVLQIYPLAAWTFERIWKYIRDNDLPYQPLHDRGYPSVGCVYCTAPVAPGGRERSGRWNGTGKSECGIHVIS